MKRPAFQFYPADWRKDAALQSCSLCARGLWVEMMCILHECEPYGVLSVNGKAMGTAQLSRLVGESERAVKKLLSELEEAGVFSRDDEGRIYSRRMVNDERVRNARAEGGKAGSEHGAKGGEYGKKGGRPKKEEGGSKTPLETPLTEGEKPPPSSSSSSSTSVGKTAEPIGSGADAPQLTPGDALFQVAVPWLVSRNVADKTARSLLGGARKQLGDEGAWSLASECIRVAPLDPVPWLAAALNARIAKKPAGRQSPTQSRSDENIQGFLDSFGEPHHDDGMTIDMETIR